MDVFQYQSNTKNLIEIVVEVIGGREVNRDGPCTICNGQKRSGPTVGDNGDCLFCNGKGTKKAQVKKLKKEYEL